MTAAAGTAGAALNCSTTIRVQIALCQCPAGTGGILGQLNEKIGNLQEQLSGISMPVLAPKIVPTTGQTALNSSMNLTGIRWDLVGLGIAVVVAVISPVEGPLGDYAAVAAFSAAW